MVFGIYRFICDVILACLWAVAGVLAVALVLLMLAFSIISLILGGLIVAVIWARNRPARATGTTLLKL